MKQKGDKMSEEKKESDDVPKELDKNVGEEDDYQEGELKFESDKEKKDDKKPEDSLENEIDAELEAEESDDDEFDTEEEKTD